MNITRRHFIGALGEITGALIVSFGSPRAFGQFAASFGSILYDPYGACDPYGDMYDQENCYGPYYDPVGYCNPYSDSYDPYDCEDGIYDSYLNYLEEVTLNKENRSGNGSKFASKINVFESLTNS